MRGRDGPNASMRRRLVNGGTCVQGGRADLLSHHQGVSFSTADWQLNANRELAPPRSDAAS